MASLTEVEIYADSRYPVDRKFIRSAVWDLLARYGMGDQRVVVEVTLVGNRKIHELNKVHRKIDSPTDVLSFPLEDMASQSDGKIHLGDVVVNYPMARDLAVKMNRIIDKVIGELVEHGVKHLLGEHHGDEKINK